MSQFECHWRWKARVLQKNHRLIRNKPAKDKTPAELHCGFTRVLAVIAGPVHLLWVKVWRQVLHRYRCPSGVSVQQQQGLVVALDAAQHYVFPLGSNLKQDNINRSHHPKQNHCNPGSGLFHKQKWKSLQNQSWQKWPKNFIVILAKYKSQTDTFLLQVTPSG